MATSISAVEASQPQRLVSAAADVGTRAAQLDTLIQTQRQSVTKLRSGWAGTAADAAVTRGEQNLASQEELRDKLRTLQSVMASGGGQLTSARTALLDMVSQLRSRGWQVSDNGVATPPPNLPRVFGSYPQAYTTMLQRLLSAYDTIDGDTATKFPTFEPKKGDDPEIQTIVGDAEKIKRQQEAEELVRRALDGDKEAAKQVDGILDSIAPNQLQPHTDPANPGVTLPPDPLKPEQAEIVSQMQNQMSGMSLDELVKVKNDLGEHGDIVGDAMQVMSDPDVKFPLVVDEQFKDMVPPGIDTEAMPGGKGMLPQSVQDALDATPVNREITDPNQTVPVTTYPSGDDLKKVAELIKAGDSGLQQGSELDRTIMERAVDVLHGAEQENKDYFRSSNPEGDSIVQDIFNSAGRDQVVSHDMITEPGSTFLDDIARHEWTDDGKSVRTLTDWIPEGAKSTDPDVAQRAGETANALTKYLSDQGDDLLKLQHPGSWGTFDDITVGEMNPDLVQGWGHALEPYQKAMIGDGEMPGFDAIPGTERSNFDAMRNVFAFMDSDKTAAAAWNEEAYRHILDYQNDPTYKNLANAGAFLGVIDSAAVQEAEARGGNVHANAKEIYDLKKMALGAALGWPAGKIPIVGGSIEEITIRGMIGDDPELQPVEPNAPRTTVADAMVQANYKIAASLVGADRGDLPDSYFNGDTLKTIDQIPPNQQREYALAVKKYIEDHGYANAMNTFYTEYQNAGGINVARPPGS